VIALYNIGIFLYAVILRIVALFHPKAQLFIAGRNNLLNQMKQQLQEAKQPRVWIHCASLGEFEQGRPVIEFIKQHYPHYCIVLTFFSPSGYEVKKNYEQADFVFYLPLDTARNAKKFIAILQPQLALFVKYEFWYHLLDNLYQRNIPALLFSAIFQERHPFFKWYGGLHRRMLKRYRQIFVQDEASKNRLAQIGITQVQIAGDTRFDRAAQVAQGSKEYLNIATFKQGKKLLIAGSTWLEDEKLLKESFGRISHQYKLLIVPHEVHAAHLRQIQDLFSDYAVSFWQESESALHDADICIVNTIGHLSFLYRYADAVWIGGGFNKTGIHNIIEPAVYGLPICFGPRYSRYREALDMIAEGAAWSTETAEALAQRLLDEKALQLSGHSAKKYVYTQLGATRKIIDYLASEKYLLSTDKKA
jgi:3-deoxy-D-manno-octulosonic-acid transferase